MKRPSTRSLRLRLLAGTLAWMLLSIAAAGWGLRTLFLDHITQQLQAQLVLQLDQLSAVVDWGAGGRLVVSPMVADPRLERPLSGLYWQIDRLGDEPRAAVARSRSLWDQALVLPPAPEGYPARGYRVLSLQDAQGHRLLAVARTLQLPDDAAPPLRLVVAGDQALLAEPLQGFTRMLLIALGVLAAGLALAVVLQLQLALRPLQLLRQRLAAVRAGTAAQLQGPFPQELQPLVTEFNHMLAENADMVQRARTQAGNLAHAVHTPLSVLANAAAQEPGPLGALVREQVDAARRQVDYHLARARAAAAVRATGLATPVLEPVRALLRTMQRLHAVRGLSFELAQGAQDAAFRGEPQDLYELLGNLIDNAGKWARSRVVVDVRREGGQLCFTVDDDGPGIPEAERERMFERGVQLDERRPGSGLGLDIVRALADTYGGSVQAGQSPLGGARLRLCLPVAA
ncbi:sensor histidine kinase [Alicycliphilus denitrificans]|uniref:histidine kinase n=2 Tax=Alicycliphilus denitrificans TaxID=179636 RepID=F4GBN6_ALIDK|nr:sensor histidine kinase [Alicycliphilus denitrificans]ADV02026.1 ATP-binding region ATPase domain protein [Alicycliphilus denitrificans BC]AEB86957.1 integral membrane sensor signal transduction histidine kinase [Alicycliphilus denitrificans K601]QKD46126.1 sensor histidine kinase [Alicycliphilus denitrificans]